jgi:hypothetical protein
MRFDREGRLKLRFCGKSFFAGGVIWIVLLRIIIPPLFGSYL